MSSNTGRGDWPIRSVWVSRRGLPSPLLRAITNISVGNTMSVIMTDWFFEAVIPPEPPPVFVNTNQLMLCGIGT